MGVRGAEGDGTAIAVSVRGGGSSGGGSNSPVAVEVEESGGFDGGVAVRLDKECTAVGSVIPTEGDR